MSVEYRQLIIKYGADISEALQGVGKLNSNVDSANKQIGSSIEGLASKMTTLGKTLDIAVTGPLTAISGLLMGAAYKTAEFGLQIEHLTQSTGMTADQLQRLRWVTTAVGGDFDGVSEQIRMLQRRLLGIEADGGTAAMSMHRLRINVDAVGGGLKGMDQLFPEVMSKLQGMTSITERNAVASQLFGRNMAAMAPLLALSSGQYAALAKNAIVLSDSQIQAAAGFEQEIIGIKQTMEAAFRSVGIEMIPLLQDQVIPLIKNDLIPAMEDGAKIIIDVARAFSILPAPLQIAIAGTVGLAYVLGPLLTGFGLIGKGIVAVTSSLGIHRAAVQLDTEAEAVKATASIRDAEAVGVDTAAIKLNTKALEENAVAVAAAASGGENAEGGLLTVGSRKFRRTGAYQNAAYEEVGAAEAAVGTEGAVAAGGIGATALAIGATVLPIALATAAIIGLGVALDNAAHSMSGLSDSDKDVENQLYKEAIAAKEATKAQNDLNDSRGKPTATLAAANDAFTASQQKLAGVNPAAPQLDAGKKARDQADAISEDIHQAQKYLAGSDSTIRNWWNAANDWVGHNLDPQNDTADFYDAQRKRIAGDKAKQKQLLTDAARGMNAAATPGSDEFKNSPQGKIWDLEKQAKDAEVKAAQAEAAGDPYGAAISKVGQEHATRQAEAIKKQQEDIHNGLTADEVRDRKQQADDLDAATTQAETRKANIKQTQYIRDRSHEESLAIANAGIAHEVAAGNLIGAAQLKLQKAYQDAMHAVTEIDPNTGQYKYTKKAREGMIAAAQSERTQATKEMQKMFYDQQAEGVALQYQTAASAASMQHNPAGDYAAAVDAAYEQGAQGWQQAVDAKAAGNPHAQAMLDAAAAKLQLNLWKAWDDARAKAAHQALAEHNAGMSAEASKDTGQSAILKFAADQAGSPVAKSLYTVEAAALDRKAADLATNVAYNSTVADLNELRLKGIPITNQLAAAEAEKSNALQGHMIQEKEVILSQVEAMRQRKEAMMGFTTPEGMWQQREITAAKEEFRDYPGRMKELVMAGVNVSSGPSPNSLIGGADASNELVRLLNQLVTGQERHITATETSGGYR